MKLADLLPQDAVLVDLRVPSKKRLLAELAVHAGRRLDLPPDAILDALVRREALGSTGMGDGVAIPHTRLTEITAPTGLFARLRTPIDFEAIDGKPVDLVFLLLLPAGQGGGQLNALACVARTLRDAGLRDALRAAQGREEMRGLLVGVPG